VQDLMLQAARLSDEEIVRRVAALAGRERQATAELIAHLAEFDRRALHRARGHGSLFSYCTGVLRLSEQAAYKRIVAARTCRRYPVSLGRLTRGQLTLSTLCLLAPYLTTENHGTLLEQADGLSKRDVELMLARRFPKADVRPSVRKLPDVPPSVPAAEAFPPLGAPAAVTPAALPIPPAHRPLVAPLAPERFRVQFTIGRETQDKLRQVQDLLRREVPDGDLAALFDRALTLLLKDVARTKLAATMAPRPARQGRVQSRHIPAHVRRAVWLRDGAQCAFVARNGRRCTERTLLEFHHLHAYALGGESTLQNISLRCREHNAYEAQLVFGPFQATDREAGSGAQLSPGRVEAPAKDPCSPYGTNTMRPTALTPPTSSSP